jgi:hypothetical protein
VYKCLPAWRQADTTYCAFGTICLVQELPSGGVLVVLLPLFVCGCVLSSSDLELSWSRPVCAYAEMNPMRHKHSHAPNAVG